MSNEVFLGTAWKDTEYDKLAKIRWLQINELANKFPNDQEFGAEVRKLVNKITYTK
tara:strand:+ start:57 stop:224 length:168 start_codon:yes stop_codon:yes gene_type:complete